MSLTWSAPSKDYKRQTVGEVLRRTEVIRAKRRAPWLQRAALDAVTWALAALIGLLIGGGIMFWLDKLARWLA